MKRFKSLRVRFALWTAAAILIVLVLFGGVVYFGLKQGLQASIDDSLRTSASQAIAAVNVDNAGIDFSDSIPSPGDTSVPSRSLTIRFLALSGKVIQSNGPFSNLAVAPDSLQHAKSNIPAYRTLPLPGSDPVRVYTAPVIYDQKLVGIVQVMESLDSVNATLDNLMRIFLLSLPILLLISALSGYSLASSALAPIDQIIQTTRQITASDLSARLNLSGADEEVRRLANTLDQMLDRLEDAFRRERQFTADASHELRTPLTAIRTILNVTRASRRRGGEYEQALDDIAEETDRLHDISEDLLMIARGEVQNSASHETVDLSALLDDVCESLLPVAEARGLGLEWHIQPGLFLKGDIDALIRLFNNLIDNSIKYTQVGTITIAAEQEADGQLCIIVADTGRGIPLEHIPHIFQRFYRVEPSRSTPGSGLGLAIVEKIVQAHQGSIEVTSQERVGTTFTLHFPVQL